MSTKAGQYHTCLLALAPDEVRLLPGPGGGVRDGTGAPAGPGAPTGGGAELAVRLQPGALTQLLFGFRPLWWIAAQRGNRIPQRARGVLDALLPAGPAWVAPTDSF